MSVMPRRASASITRGSCRSSLVALVALVDGHVRLLVGLVLPAEHAVLGERHDRLVDLAVVAVPADDDRLAVDRLARRELADRLLRRLAQLDRGEAPALADALVAAQDRRRLAESRRPRAGRADARSWQFSLQPGLGNLAPHPPSRSPARLQSTTTRRASGWISLGEASHDRILPARSHEVQQNEVARDQDQLVVILN